MFNTYWTTLIVGSICAGGLVGCILPSIRIHHKKKSPPPYLSPKRTNSEIPVVDMLPHLKLRNKLTEEDLKNDRYKQRKL